MEAQGLSPLGVAGEGRRPNPSGPMSSTGQSTTRKSFITRLLKQKPGLTSLEELDPEILRTYEKLGIPAIR